jgi:hypothetical protein
MRIQNGLVPKWMADRINPPKDEADNGSDPRPIPAQTAAGIKVPPVSLPEKDRTLEMSSSSGGRHPSIGTNPKRLQGGRPLRSFPRAQARRLRTQGLSLRAIGARMGVPASTVADALKVTSRAKTR